MTRRQDYATGKQIKLIGLALMLMALASLFWMSWEQDKFKEVNSKLDNIPHRVCWNETIIRHANMFDENYSKCASWSFWNMNVSKEGHWEEAELICYQTIEECEVR